MNAYIKRLFLLFVALTIITMSFMGCTRANEKSEHPVDNFKVVAYIRGDYVQTEDSLCAEDFDIITDVILFECASFNNKGEVICEEQKLGTALKNIRKAIGGRNVRITVNLLGPAGAIDSTDWEEQMEAQSVEHNKAFKSGILEDNIVSFLEKHNFDGVHFDYEYPLSSKAWYYYNSFLVSLDKELGDYTLGVAGVDWNIRFSKKAEEAIDSFELMSYDFVDDKGKHATFEDTVKLVENADFGGIAREKIRIGIPFYSRPTDMAAYWYGYDSCYEKIDDNGWYHCEDTNKDFWFNTSEVVEKKTAYAINTGYGGVMVWHYNCDIPSTNDDSLFRAIGSAVSKNEEK